MQDKKINYTDSVNYNYKIPGYTIQKKDLLNIKVLSVDPKISDIFNITDPSLNSMATPGSLYINSYQVSDSGYISMPVIGKIQVINLSLVEAQEKIQDIISEHLQQAVVLIKLVNFRITVLGEVKNPGLLYYNNEQLTIFEAIGIAGDLTDLGNRRKIKLIRNSEGKTSVIYLDITNPSVINSEYYYVKPNDVLYVENFKIKPFRYNIGSLPVILSLFTSLVIVLKYFKP